MIDYENDPIIAAVRTKSDFELALSSDLCTVFLLASDIMTIDDYVRSAHERGKALFVHMDFVEGLSKDTAGVAYLSTKGIDGIISTRSNIINYARENKISCIQRFFMIDSRSESTALETMKQTKPDMIELMPGIAYKTIERIKKSTSVPIIAGGLIDSKEEIYKALAAGASMISTGNHMLWNM
jgi:glycerol uptake operon antiterminator